MVLYNITLIGSGNVNHHLGINLKRVGHNIDYVYSRNIDHAKELGKLTSSIATDDLQMLKKTASDLYIIAVNDDAIQEITDQLQVKNNGVVSHTSGTTSMTKLQTTSRHFGVLYPLQTFTKGSPLDLLSVPICIETNDQHSEKLLRSIAGSISNTVYPINERERIILHICGVFVNNFTNHLMGIAEKLLTKEKLEMKILEPLIKETFIKSFTQSPSKNQTGPAIRNDKATIEKHLSILEEYPEFMKIYHIITNSIQGITEKA